MKSRLNVLIPTMCAFALMAGSLFADEFQELMAAASRAERQGEFVRAIVTFNSALLQALTPDRQAMVYLNRGGAYAFNGEMDRAISDWDESIRLNPGLADAYNNRATGYYQKGDYKKAVAMLLGFHANINVKRKIDGRTPLILAVADKKKEMIEFLIEQGAKVSVMDNGGRTALDYALRQGDVDMATRLRREGARRGQGTRLDTPNP